MNPPRMTIIVADDEPLVRDVLRSYIDRDGGFDLLAEADDGARALQLVQLLKPQAMILDLAMPNMNGLEALPEIRLASPGTKVVVLSSMVPLDGVKSSALSLGAVAVFNKDVPPEKLLDVFRGEVPVTSYPAMDVLPNRAS